MTPKGPKGIVSPWNQPSEVPSRTAAPPSLWKSERDDMDAPTSDLVRFRGRTRSLNLKPLHGKGEPEAQALLDLGRALAALMLKVPETRAIFAKQSLGFDKPVSPHIVLDLGGVPFYAGTTTAEPEMARRMAVDRIAHALTESAVKHPKAKALLADYRVEVSNS